MGVDISLFAPFPFRQILTEAIASYKIDKGKYPSKFSIVNADCPSMCVISHLAHIQRPILSRAESFSAIDWAYRAG